MSEENRTADANLHALHAERAALRQAAQQAGIVVGQSGDTYHAALNDAKATGATPGAALVALCVRLQQSAEAWEDIARDEAKKHGEALAIVKRLRAVRASAGLSLFGRFTGFGAYGRAEPRFYSPPVW